MEYIIAGIRIAVPQEFTAGSFGTALAPFAAADEGPADLSVETRGEIRQADGYRELDEFDSPMPTPTAVSAATRKVTCSP